jgi:hypothetical protein
MTTVGGANLKAFGGTAGSCQQTEPKAAPSRRKPSQDRLA